MVKNLKELRKKLHISQQVLAEKVGVSQQSINKYENHSVEPDITTLISIADYFNVTVDYLIGHETSNFSEISAGIAPSDLLFLREYKRLNSTEQICINKIIQTFNDTKN